MGIACDDLLIRNENLITEEGKNAFYEYFKALMETTGSKYDFLFSINRVPTLHFFISIGDEQYDIFSLSQVPMFTWVVDNISHHIEAFQAHHLATEEIVLVTDRCSVEMGNRYNFDMTESSFLPMWGPERMASQGEGADRDIPVLFTGDIRREKPYQDFLEQASNGDPELRKVLDAAVEEMIDDKGTVDGFSLIHSKCAEIGRHEAALPTFRAMDRWLRTRRRKDMLKSVSRVPIMLLGTVEDPEIAEQQNISVLGRKNIHEAEQFARRAKVLLGDFANFVDGVELRPAIAIANGCVFACEENTFVKREFTTNSYISLLLDGARSDEALMETIENPARLIEMDENAAAFYQQQLNTAPGFMSYFGSGS